MRAPADPEASFLLAQRASQQGDFRTAIAALERVLLLYPDLDNIRLELGVLYIRTGSIELGQAYIQKALESPDAPPEVRERAREILAAATQSARRLTYGGSVSAGLISDSNANSGPDGGTTLGGSVVTRGTGESDVSAFVSATGGLRYDLGFQPGHLFALDAGVYSRSYSDLDFLDLSQLTLSPGFDFNLGRVFDRPAALIFRLNHSTLWRDGEVTIVENGATASFRLAVGERNQVQVSGFAFDQDFRKTELFPANEIRTGERYGMIAALQRTVSENARLRFALGHTTKTARVEFEEYDETSLSIGYTQGFRVAFLEERPFEVAFRGRYAWRDFAGPDPKVTEIAPDLDEAQSDEAAFLSVSLNTPITERLSLFGEAGSVMQTSNYPLDEYENYFVSLGLTSSF